jgi:hypothetical protein
VHGMSGKKLCRAADVSTVLPRFMRWVGESPLVAHNAKYVFVLSREWLFSFLRLFYICCWFTIGLELFMLIRRFDVRLLSQDLQFLKLENLLKDKVVYVNLRLKISFMLTLT